MDSAECSVEQWLGFFMGAGIPNRVAADYAVTFSDNRMRPDMLPDLSKDYLRDMDITVMGDVIAILKHAKSVSQQAYTAKKISSGSAAVAAAASRSRPAAAAAAAVAAPRAAVRPLRSEPAASRPLRADPAPRALRTEPAPRPLRSDPAPRPAEQTVPVRAKRTSDVADDGGRWAGPPAPKRRIVPPGPDAPAIDDMDPEPVRRRSAVLERVRPDQQTSVRSRPITQTVTRLGQPAPAPAPAAPVRPGFGRPRAERSVSPERPSPAAAPARGGTRFTITGLGGIAAAVQPHQRQPLGRQSELEAASAPPKQRITFGGEREPSGPAAVPRRTVGTAVRTRVDDAPYRTEVVPRRRVVPPSDSPVPPEPSAHPPPSRVRPVGSTGVRSASARERLAGRDEGFRSATSRVRPAATQEAPSRGVRTAATTAAAATGVRVRTTAVARDEEYDRPAGSRLKPPPARVRPTTVRTRPSTDEYDEYDNEYDEYDEPARPSMSRLKPPPGHVRPTTVRTRPSAEEYDEYDEPARPVGSRLKPPPAAAPRSGGVKARLGGGGGTKMRLTTGAGKVVKLKGSSVYSRLGNAGR